MKGITLWGSIASIVGLVVALITLYPSSSSQAGNQATTYGNQSPAINEPKGDVNIQYQNNQYHNTIPPRAQKAAVLRNQRGATLVVSEPSMDAAMDTKKHVCTVIAGTPVTVLSETADLQGIAIWRKMKIDSGECVGKIGWAAVDSISIE